MTDGIKGELMTASDQQSRSLNLYEAGFLQLRKIFLELHKKVPSLRLAIKQLREYARMYRSIIHHQRGTWPVIVMAAEVRV